MKFGNAIRIARAARKLSQKDLAAAANVDASYISLLEADRRVPATSTLEAISKVLKIPLHLLILLASEEEDLHGISTKQAEQLSRQMLDMLLRR